MKRTILPTAAFLLCAITAGAQNAGRVYRTEILPYTTRQQAEARNTAASAHRIDFAPVALGTIDQGVRVGQSVEIPYAWTDGEVYLHLENIGSAYALRLNGELVAEVEDPATPAQFRLTPLVREGKNALTLDMRPSRAAAINAQASGGKAFSGSHLYFQNKRSISDFEVQIVPDSTRKFGILDLKIIARNGFNYEEPVTVGYDIYTPQGKLIDFNIKEVTIPGRSVDTLRFTPHVYSAYQNKWEAGGKTLPPLYKVMLFTKRDGAYREYMPIKVGFGTTELIDGKIMRLGRELTPVIAPYNAAADAKTTRTQLLALKAQGKNTVTPSCPQPAWYYELCNELGIYVIDRANIHAPEKRDDRTIGGTPSNDPALAQEYLERVQAMYYRSRNFTCVIAYALGADAGNGYNMYKAYQWLKSVEPSRPIIYEGADGEWNSDL